MKKHIVLTFFIIGVVIGSASSQNPGLLGKHFIIHYNYDYQLNFFGGGIYGIESKGLMKIKPFIRGKHEISSEYVFSRWQSIQVDYSFAWNRDFDNFIKYQTHEIALSYKQYYVHSRVSSIAPLGNYIRPKIFASMSRYVPYTSSNGGYFGSELEEPDSFLHYGASIEFGRQSIVFKKILLDLGVSFGYMHFTKKEVNAFRGEYDYENGFGVLYNNSPYKHMMFQRLVSFRVGFGIPLF